MKYDFQGWATKYNVLCSDGRTIKPGAFKDQDGAKVPMVWAHIHDDPEAVLGHAYLEHRDEGMWCYGAFNSSDQGQNAKLLVEHGDVDSVSICANKLKQTDKKEVLHGKIRELSLVLAGANEGAHIEPILAHSDDSEESEIIVYTDEFIELNHEDEEPVETITHEEKGAEPMAETEKKERTVGDVIDSMNEEQRNVLMALVTEAMESGSENNNTEENNNTKEEKEMKHNVFEGGSAKTSGTLTHSDLELVKANAKRCGSFAEAYKEFMSDRLQHDGTESDATESEAYGITGLEDVYFPDARQVGENPYLIARDTSWVGEFMSRAQHSPFARIKSTAADITADEARARGYIKGNRKKEEVFTVLKRVTTPTTVYKKQKFDRDDLVDITEWEVVPWTKREMRKMLDEEVAVAALIGDGRLGDDPDKINELNIRPVLTDHPLFTIRIDMANSGVDSTGSRARDFINAVIYNRRKWKGSGKPDLYTTEDMLAECLMLTDEIGRDLFEDEAKLATKLRVRKIITVDAMEQRMPNVYGILLNPEDYTFGSNQGGNVEFFDDFDIDFNQQKFLLETRLSGALRRPFSAMVFTGTPISGVSGSDYTTAGITAPDGYAGPNGNHWADNSTVQQQQLPGSIQVP